MHMTVEEFHARFPGRPPLILVEYAGEWIAWNDDRTQILAHGTDFSDVYQRAAECGCVRPVLQKVPRGPFVGIA